MRRPSCATPRGGSRRSSPTWRCSAPPGELYLLAQPTALDDLRLDEGQRAQGGRALRPCRPALDRTRSATRPRLPAPAERVRIALEQARANEAEVDAILTPVATRPAPPDRPSVGGAGRLSRAGGRRGARLTPGQRERIRAIEEEALFRQIREMRIGKGIRRRRHAGDGPDPGRAHRRARRDAGASWPASRSAAR